MAIALKKRLRATNPAYTTAMLSLGVLAGLLFLLNLLTIRNSGPDGDPRELTVYCAASLRIPAEQIAKDYQAEFGIAIHFRYGGSNSLLNQLEISNQGDLYLAADESYLKIAQEKELVAEVFPLAQMSAVIIVPFENPAQIQTVDDLFRKDLRIVLANPDLAAMGKTTRECFEKIGKWEQLEACVRKQGVFKPTVSEVANDVVLGSVDAGIVWDAVAEQVANRNPSKLKIIRAPELSAGSTNLCVGVLNSSKSPESALHFARYLAAPDHGQKVFKSRGYQPINEAL